MFADGQKVTAHWSDGSSITGFVVKRPDYLLLQVGPSISFMLTPPSILGSVDRFEIHDYQVEQWEDEGGAVF